MRITKAIAGSACLWLIGIVAGWADTITLKDGTTLTGTIITETESSVSIEISNASGSISRQDIISRADIASYHRLTEAERAERAMTDDYIKLREYALKPDAVQSKEYYERVINEVFRKFLSRYPNSPYEKEVTETIVQWEAERDKVAAGLVKFQGEWMSEQEAGKSQQFAQTQQLLKDGEAAVASGKWGRAVQAYEALLDLTAPPGATAIARRQLPEAYRQWEKALRQRQPRLDQEITATQQRADRAQQALQSAQNALKSALATGERMGQQGNIGGAAPLIMGAQLDIRNANAELAAAKAQLAKLSHERDFVKQSIDGLPNRVSKYGVDLTTNEVAGATTAVAATAQRPAGDTPGLLTEIREFFETNWVYIALIGGVLILVLVRIVTR